MSGNERRDPSSGPMGNLSQAYFGNLDVLMKGYEPALKGVGRANLEVAGLVTKRAQAWLEIPARLSQVRTPQDLIKEQLRFWQAAAHDYAEGSRRFVAALGACGVPAFNGEWRTDANGQSRDYITFPEPKEQAASAPKRDRRAA